MSSLFRSFFFTITIIAVAVALLISFSGILPAEPRGLVISSAEFVDRDSIKIGENATLMMVLSNMAPEPKTFELHIIYSGNLSFYDGITKESLLNISRHGIYYNLTYPVRGTLDTQGSTNIPILARGLEPIGESQTYTIFIEVFSVEGYDKELADKASVQLTVARS